MQLRRELKIGQKAAWFMLHRLWLSFDENPDLFSGPVEADENLHGREAQEQVERGTQEAERARGPVDMTAVAGVKDRETKRVMAKVVEHTDAPTLQRFVEDQTCADAQVYTDDAKAYVGIDRPHEAVKHSVSEYVRGMAHTNGMESFWSMLKRGHDGIYHKMSPKHLDRYVKEFTGRHNVREADTIDQMREVVAGMVGKRLRYSDLTADIGLASGARG